MLDQLTVSYRKELRSQLRLRWHAENDPFNSLNQQAIDDSFRLLETNAADLISEAAMQSLAISRAPETFAQLSKAISTYLTQIEGDLAHKIFEVGRIAASAFFSGSQTAEFRRQMERLTDAYRAAFFVNLETEPKTAGKKRGPTPVYDWLQATNVVWGRIYRGDLQPVKQRDIELALMEAATNKNKKDMGDTTSRPYARPIWKEMGYDPED